MDLDTYYILIEELGLQIKKLRAELDFLNEELYLLKAQSQVWENPFSIYNKEIVLNNGSSIFCKILSILVLTVGIKTLNYKR